ncbi:hypothetical protein DEO72_LG5g1875 [Vigna unguiculata]|uniref:Uncharacterized protein n=1 Tax=Vigna unguiculata TaxID=3917 RepID=A0A4D6LXR1_VIGUN|nr:hypothetical protein DEO72_LG5g1875 [Vigna unguiculata]
MGFENPRFKLQSFLDEVLRPALGVKDDGLLMMVSSASTGLVASILHLRASFALNPPLEPPLVELAAIRRHLELVPLSLCDRALSRDHHRIFSPAARLPKVTVLRPALGVKDDGLLMMVSSASTGLVASMYDLSNLLNCIVMR